MKLGLGSNKKYIKLLIERKRNKKFTSKVRNQILFWLLHIIDLQQLYHTKKKKKKKELWTKGLMTWERPLLTKNKKSKEFWRNLDLTTNDKSLFTCLSYLAYNHIILDQKLKHDAVKLSIVSKV